MRIKLLSLSFIFLTVAPVAAQELRVSLRSENGPLPYAYLYLNGRAAAVTDTLGVARLETGRWHTGDTLTVSYAGTTPESRVIDAETARQGHCTLVLQEIYTALTTDRVVVRGDVERFFRRAVREHSGCVDGCWGEAQLQGEVSMSYSSAQNGLRDSISGRITTHRNEVSPRNYLDHDYRLTIDREDSAGQSEPSAELLRELNRMLWVSIGPIFQLQEHKIFGDHRRKLSYLGQKEGLRIFRAVFPQVAIGNDSIYLQIVAYVDEATKLPQAIEAEYLRKDLKYSVRVRAEYTPYRLNAGWYAGRICLTPASIDYRMVLEDTEVNGRFRDGRFLSPTSTRKRSREEPLYVPL